MSLPATATCLVLALAACGSAPRRVAAVPPQPATAARVVPFGVASPDAASIYVVNPDGKVDAIDAATGATRWTGASAGRPLLALDDALFALVDGRAVIQRAAAPAVVWASDVIPQADQWSEVREVRIEQHRLTGELWLVHPGSGAMACSERASGMVTVDLVSGRVAATIDASGTWQQGGRSCAPPPPATLNGVILQVRQGMTPVRGEASGSMLLPRWLDAIDATTRQLRWSHPVPPADITPWA